MWVYLLRLYDPLLIQAPLPLLPLYLCLSFPHPLSPFFSPNLPLSPHLFSLYKYICCSLFLYIYVIFSLYTILCIYICNYTCRFWGSFQRFFFNLFWNESPIYKTDNRTIFVGALIEDIKQPVNTFSTLPCPAVAGEVPLRNISDLLTD